MLSPRTRGRGVRREGKQTIKSRMNWELKKETPDKFEQRNSFVSNGRVKCLNFPVVARPARIGSTCVAGMFGISRHHSSFLFRSDYETFPLIIFVQATLQPQLQTATCCLTFPCRWFWNRIFVFSKSLARLILGGKVGMSRHTLNDEFICINTLNKSIVCIRLISAWATTDPPNDPHLPFSIYLPLFLSAMHAILCLILTPGLAQLCVMHCKKCRS